MTLLLLLVACTSETDSAGNDTAETGLDTADSGSNEPGVLVLSFRMDVDNIDNMEEPPLGTFKGSIYAEDQSTAIGPIDGAVSLIDFEVLNIDLSTTGGPTAALWSSDPLPSQKLWVLGCLDSDANDCDKKDPITVPNENKLLLAAGGETPFTVYLGMLSP